MLLFSACAIERTLALISYIFLPCYARVRVRVCVYACVRVRINMPVCVFCMLCPYVFSLVHACSSRACSNANMRIAGCFPLPSENETTRRKNRNKRIDQSGGEKTRANGTETQIKSRRNVYRRRRLNRSLAKLKERKEKREERRRKKREPNVFSNLGAAMIPRGDRVRGKERQKGGARESPSSIVPHPAG